MDRKEVEYLQGLLEIFKVEAQEHISAIANGLIELEKAKADERAPLVEAVYREAHSLKGAARAVNMAEIEDLCQRLESTFAEMKRPQAPWSPALFDALHRAATELDAMLQSPHTTRSVAETARTQRLYRDLEATAGLSRNPSPKSVGAVREPPLPTLDPEPERSDQAEPVAHNPRPTNAQSPSHPRTRHDHKPSRSLLEDRGADTIRVATTKLDALLLQAEELLSARLTAGFRAAELRDLTASIAAWTKEWSKVRSDVRAMEQVMERGEANPLAPPRDRGRRQTRSPIPDPRSPIPRNLLEFLNWNQSFVKSLENRVANLSKASEQDQSALAGMTGTLLADVKDVLMLPFASLLEVFPRMARDLARSRGKNVNLVIRGGAIELDRRILEALKDPLIHLVRNAIDHGIEAPEDRTRSGKPAQGTVTIAISQKDANKIEVLVSDDGAGISAQRVLASAIKSGLLPENEHSAVEHSGGERASEGDAGKLDEAAALSLIFHSGLSTSPVITDLSGRGLGLAIVREKVEKLGGTVSVESRSLNSHSSNPSNEPSGTVFRLVLPLTLATCRGILVRAGHALFLVPITHVERVVSVQAGQIRTVGGQDTIMLDGEAVSLARLGDALGLTGGEAEGKPVGAVREPPLPAVVLSTGEKRIGFLVEEVLDEQEVLVKGLGAQLVRVRNISGATVLGSGKVVPILNVVDLLGARHASSSTQAGGRYPPKHTGKELEVARRDTRPRSILVAEDSITSRTLLKNILEAAGYTVKTAIDGAEALAELHATEYDLLVSDIEMPRMNGFDLVARVRADTKLADLPVVLVTSLESREDRERGAEVGADAYLVKRGFDQANLLEVIRRLI